ncbi:hypothetical protein ACCS78_41040, partial [Rhizobium johnstonii]
FLNAFEAKLNVDWVYNDPILSLTNAAKSKRVYKMPLGGYRWDPPSQESPLSWMWTANLLLVHRDGAVEFDRGVPAARKLDG